MAPFKLQTRLPEIEIQRQSERKADQQRAEYDRPESAHAEGPSLALGPGAGAHHRNATAANLAVMILNQVAGSVGTMVHYEEGTRAATSGVADLQSAIEAMASGQIGVAIVHGANPAYSLPTAVGFREAFERVPFKVSFASADETKALTGMMIGGVTVFALPSDMPIYVDDRVMQCEWIIVGGGSRSAKIRVTPDVLQRLPKVTVVPGLAGPA